VPESGNTVNDEHVVNEQAFVADVKRLRQSRTFLYKQALSVEMPPTPLTFEEIEILTYSAKGRGPSLGERITVDRLTETIFRTLSEPLRRKFLMGERPWWLSGLPVIFDAVAVISLVVCITMVSSAPPRELENLVVAIAQSRSGDQTVAHSSGGAAGTVPPSAPGPASASASPSPSIPLGARVLPFYLLWLMSLGATGAVAFIGTNVLSVQEDATFDLTNTRLMALRITTPGRMVGPAIWPARIFKPIPRRNATMRSVGSTADGAIAAADEGASFMRSPYHPGAARQE
jgi:hypothetical protein